MPEIIIVPALFGTIAFIVWTIASNWQRNRHLREMTAFHARIIDRMGSIKDFNDFLQTPGGLQFMNAITADKGPTGPRERILRAVQTGIVLSSVGVGTLPFVVRAAHARASFEPRTRRNHPNEERA